MKSAAVPGAVVVLAWVLALGVVAAPLVGLPELEPSRTRGVDRTGLVACLALVACSMPRPAAFGPAARFAARPALGALATVVLFLPAAGVAGVLDAQDARARTPGSAALLLALACALAWSAERARRERRLAIRYAGAWALLLGLPAVAATLFAATVPLLWTPLVWSLAPRDPRQALGPSLVVALVLGLVLGPDPDPDRVPEPSAPREI